MEQKKHWQSFGELNKSEAYNNEVQNEFKEELPFVEDASTLEKGESFLQAKAPRRDFLKYVGFSTAAAAVLKPTYFKKSRRGAFACKKLSPFSKVDSSSTKGSSSLNSF